MMDARLKTKAFWLGKTPDFRKNAIKAIMGSGPAEDRDVILHPDFWKDRTEAERTEVMESIMGAVDEQALQAKMK